METVNSLKLISGAISSSETDNRGWAASWGDYNNDGFIDLVIASPKGFVGGSPIPSILYLNNGDGRFTQVTDYEFTKLLTTYTVATWSDYDLDGDLDLFFGAGPVGTAPNAPDFLYKNMLKETGTVSLERITTGTIATDIQNGQVWNWIDIDNDGDLDAYVTNYGGVKDHLYINDNGNYKSVDNDATTIDGQHLANNWGDTDNDGDLDLIITSETQNYFYKNDGNGNLTSDSTAFTIEAAGRGVSLGDYDDDGDLDVFISGSGEGTGLFMNNNSNGNNWINFVCKGSVSNKAAIGTKVKIKANVNGKTVWQMREISAQNSFNAMNSLRVHFGLGNAATVDSAVVIWPQGGTSVLTNLQPNKFYEVTEEIPSGFFNPNFTADTIKGITPVQVHFKDLTVADPNMPATEWKWDFNNDGIIDATEENPTYTYSINGIFSVALTVGNGSTSKKITREKYIRVTKIPGVPIVTSVNPLFTDTVIYRGSSINFSAAAYDTSGYDIKYSWYKNRKLVSEDSLYHYATLFFITEPKFDTLKLEISNGYNYWERSWYIKEDTASATGVKQIPNAIPTEYKLEQNFPNPFNPETRINFALPKESNVNIKIFNTLGKEVAEILNERKSAGIYSAAFNAKNLPSGIYFYRLNAGSYSSTKKMIVLK